MKRKIYNQLIEWKEKRSRKEALLIDGARRVGKSWIVEEFARREYKKREGLGPTTKSFSFDINSLNIYFSPGCNM